MILWVVVLYSEIWTSVSVVATRPDIPFLVNSVSLMTFKKNVQLPFIWGKKAKYTAVKIGLYYKIRF